MENDILQILNQTFSALNQDIIHLSIIKILIHVQGIIIIVYLYVI